MDEDLGMNLFLGDEFYDEETDKLPDPNEYIIDNDEELDENPEEEQEESDDGENQDKVGGEAEDNNPEGKSDVNSSPPLYKSLASYLHTEGVLSSVDSSKLEGIKSLDDVKDLMIEEIKARELADLTPVQKEAVEAFREGISVDTFRKQKETEEQLENITEDAIENDENLRRQIIYQNFVNKGYTEEKATKFTDRSFEVGEDVQDAKESLDDIKIGIKERFKEQREYEANLQKKRLEDSEKERKEIESKILKTEEPFEGIKVNEVARKKILEAMLVPVGKNPNTGEDENALMKAQREDKEFSRKLYSVFALTKGFTDFSVFGKQQTKKTINELEKALKSNQHVITGGDPSFTDDPNASDYDIGDKLVF